MKSIFTAIDELLKFQSSCTIPQIAKISGKKQMDVLKCLNTNTSLIKKDGKGKVVGFKDYISVQRNAAYNAGKSYTVQVVNYGAQEVFETKNPAAKALEENYICGGIGDSWTIRVILKSEKNENKLAEMGILPYNDVPVITISDAWVEE